MRRLYWTLLLLLGCGDSAVNMAGNYSIALTSGDNGCNFQGWTVGAMTSGIPLSVTQSGQSVSAVVGGAAGLYVNGALGSNTFTGTASGTTLVASIHGTRSYTQGACTYTITAIATGSLAGDYLSGNIDYTTNTNASPQCGSIQGCHSRQQFNGTRPPTR